jgi:RNA polymerase sigma-70 factor, ECF subfamily
MGNVAAVEDLAQDTFLQIWTKPTAFNPAKAGVRAYLFGIARKKAADWWRHQPSVVPEEAAAMIGIQPPSVLALNNALELVAPELRNVLWLREVEGYSYEELSKILDIPLGTVKSRLFAAREQLRKIWRPA